MPAATRQFALLPPRGGATTSRHSQLRPRPLPCQSSVHSPHTQRRCRWAEDRCAGARVRAGLELPSNAALTRLERSVAEGSASDEPACFRGATHGRSLTTGAASRCPSTRSLGLAGVAAASELMVRAAKRQADRQLGEIRVIEHFLSRVLPLRLPPTAVAKKARLRQEAREAPAIEPGTGKLLHHVGGRPNNHGTASAGRVHKSVTSGVVSTGATWMGSSPQHHAHTARTGYWA
jgi:hypothetical protein